MTSLTSPLGAELPPMTREEARAVTEQCRDVGARIWSNFEELKRLLEDLYHRRGWSALNYSSFADFCEAELSDLQIWSTVEQRQSQVLELRDAGFSLRGIAASLGMNEKTVRNDLSAKSSGAEYSAPESRLIIGQDGKKYTQNETPVAQRRAAVDALHKQGLNQKQIAMKFGVSPATIAADVAHNTKPVVSYHDVMQRFGDIDEMPSQLPKLAIRGVEELKTAARFLYNDVVQDDDWVDNGPARLRSVRELVPGLSQTLVILAQCVQEIAVDDLPDDEAIRVQFTQEIEQAVGVLQRWGH